MQKYAFLISCSLLATSAIAEQASTAKTTLFDDARSGNKEAIQKRLENDEDCSGKEEGTGKTALHIAAENGYTELVDILTMEPDRSGFFNWFWYCVYTSAKIPHKDAQDNDGNTPVHLAIQAGKSTTTEHLLQKGANTDICNKEKYPAPFMILKKDDPALIQLLARYHVLNKKVNGKTVLHISIKQGKKQLTPALLKEGSLNNEKDDKGRTIASIASKNCDIPALKMLLEHNININVPDTNGARPFHHAAYSGNYDVVKFFLENKISHEVTDNKGNTPAHYAAESGNISVIDLLFAHKANIQQRNKDGEDILLIAMNREHWPLARDLVSKYKFNINTTDQKGRTGLIRAAENGHYEVVKYWFDLGADLQLCDYDKENALHKAGRSKNKNLAQFILSQDKKLLETKNIRGETPFFIAVNEGYADVAELFIKEGASINITNDKGQIPLFISVERGYDKTTNAILQAGASLMVTDNEGNTVIHVAAQQSKSAILASILQQRSKPHIDTPNKAGLTALHCAARANNVAGMKLLEQQGAAWNLVDNNGNTLAHSAIAKDASDSIAYILQRNPVVLETPNKQNEVPFIFACKTGSLKCLQHMIKDTDFCNRNVESGLKVAEQNGMYYIRNFLQKESAERRDLCRKIGNIYSRGASLTTQNEAENNKVNQKVEWYNRKTYTPSQLKYYTEDQLYYMTEAERTKVYNTYLEFENREQQIYTHLSQQYKALVAQDEAAQRQARAEQQERDRVAAQQRREEEQRERERIYREQQLQRQLQENEQKQRKLQEEQLRQQRELDPAAQQREFDYHKNKQEKEKADTLAAQKHQQALEGQQPRADMNLKPSAPAAESQQCAQCNKKLPGAKPLPCVKCKKKVEGICPQCVKTYAGRCPECFELHTLGIEKQKGECCICKEQNVEVTTSPCTKCTNRKDYICTECFKGCLEINKAKNLGNKCPLCTELTLNKELAEKIIAQQK